MPTVGRVCQAQMSNFASVITLTDLIFASILLGCIPFGVYFWRRHRGSRLTRWLAAIFLALGLTGIQTFVKRWLPLPPLPDVGGPAAFAGAPWWLGPAWVATSVIDVLINGFFYYAVLVVALLYNGYARRWLVALLAAPLALTYAIGIDVWRDELNRHLIAAWGAAYWIAAAVLFTVAAMRERRRGEAHEVIPVTAMAVVLLVPALMVIPHQLQYSTGNLLTYLLAVGLSAFGLFTYLYVRNTHQAIRKELHDRAARLEAALAEHALKNSIAKVRLHALNMRQGLATGEYDRVEQAIEHVLATADQMMHASRHISQAGGGQKIVPYR